MPLHFFLFESWLDCSFHSICWLGLAYRCCSCLYLLAAPRHAESLAGPGSPECVVHPGALQHAPAGCHTTSNDISPGWRGGLCKQTNYHNPPNPSILHLHWLHFLPWRRRRGSGFACPPPDIIANGSIIKKQFFVFGCGKPVRRQSVPYVMD